MYSVIHALLLFTLSPFYGHHYWQVAFYEQPTHLFPHLSFILNIHHLLFLHSERLVPVSTHCLPCIKTAQCACGCIIKESHLGKSATFLSELIKVDYNSTWPFFCTPFKRNTSGLPEFTSPTVWSVFQYLVNTSAKHRWAITSSSWG